MIIKIFKILSKNVYERKIMPGSWNVTHHLLLGTDTSLSLSEPFFKYLKMLKMTSTKHLIFTPKHNQINYTNIYISFLALFLQSHHDHTRTCPYYLYSEESLVFRKNLSAPPLHPEKFVSTISKISTSDWNPLSQ